MCVQVKKIFAGKSNGVGGGLPFFREMMSLLIRGKVVAQRVISLPNRVIGDREGWELGEKWHCSPAP